jgi:hypothetical protein
MKVAYVLLVTLIAVPAWATDPQGQELPRPLLESEVINDRIDVHAQRAIVRLSKGSFEQRVMSRFLLRGVQYGALGGIYKVDTQVPALRGQRIGKGWWTLLDGRPAGCLKEPADEKPILIFGKSVATQPSVLDPALMTALDECGFRKLDVLVTKATTVPCSEALITLSSDATGVLVAPPCHTTEQGVCHFYFPPAMYQFNVTCDGGPTSPPDIFRAVAPGTGVQVESFDFAGSTPTPAPPRIPIPTPTPTPTPAPTPTTKPNIKLKPGGTRTLGKIPRPTTPPKSEPTKKIRIRPGTVGTPSQPATPPFRPPVPQTPPEPPAEEAPPPSTPPPPESPPGEFVDAPDCSVAPKLGGECWTTEDVLDSTIDHHAQSAMFRMFAQVGLPSAEASAILCAVKEGKLEGVFLPAQGVPATRARTAGSNYWDMIPPGAHSTCYTEQPLEGPAREPLIVFRDQIKDDKDFVAAAITSAFRSCNLEERAPRCYIPTIAKPPPPPSNPGGGGTPGDCVYSLVDAPLSDEACSSCGGGKTIWWRKVVATGEGCPTDLSGMVFTEAIADGGGTCPLGPVIGGGACVTDADGNLTRSGGGICSDTYRLCFQKEDLCNLDDDPSVFEVCLLVGCTRTLNQQIFLDGTPIKSRQVEFTVSLTLTDPLTGDFDCFTSVDISK